MRYTKNLHLAKPSPDDFYDIAEFGNNMDILDEFYGTTFQESNRNLLDNAWFTLNSRGKSVYSGGNGQYTLDRWHFGADDILTVTVLNKGIKVVGDDWYSQVVGGKELFGETLTASILLEDGTIYHGTGFLRTDSVAWESVALVSNEKIELRLQNYDGIGFQFGIVNKGTNIIRAVKLELGEVSTLDKDNPPDDRLEYIKCITSKADPNDTYANKPINFASNRNLLLNPWFTVNQEGKTTWNGAGYTVDRWLNYGGGAMVEIVDNGIKLTKGSADLVVAQKIEDIYGNSILGETVTLSVMLGNGEIKYRSIKLPTSYQIYDSPNIELDTGWFADIVYSTNTNLFTVRLVAVSTATEPITIKGVKLEVGSVSTLHLDVAPNYAEELLKCQREFVRLTNKNLGYQPFATGVGNGVNQAVFNIPTPVPMRITPTISFSNLRIVGKGCDYVPVKSIQATDVVGSSVTALVTVDSPSTISNGEVYQIGGNDVGIIDISARR